MHPLQDLARFNIRSAAESLLFTKFSGLLESSVSAYRRWRHTDDQIERVLLACQPRGGSTWLGEMLLTLPRSALVWEPFNPTWNPACQEAGFGWHNYWPSGLGGHQKKFARSVLRGHRIQTGHFGPFGNSLDAIASMAQARTLVFKCTNVNLMLHHLDDLLSSEVIVLLRHPCAVVASQLAHGGWEDVTNENPDVVMEMERVLHDYPEWEPMWSACKTQEEVLAFIWGVRTAVPLLHARSEDGLVVTYEELVSDSHAEIERIFQHLNRSLPEGIWDQVGVPSATTQDDSNVERGGNPLETWTRRLTERQVTQILNVVHDMGIDVYTEKLRPRDGHPASHIEARACGDDVEVSP